MVVDVDVHVDIVVLVVIIKIIIAIDLLCFLRPAAVAASDAKRFPFVEN